MALAAKRMKTVTPRGNTRPPEYVLGQAGSAKKLVDVDNGHTVPVNPQNNLDGIVENEPTLTSLPKRRSIVDSQYVPLSHIIVNAEGDKWPVNYFKQNLGLNDEMMPLAKGTSGAHQQYTKYIEFILHVTSPIAQQQEQETKEFTVTGEATLFFGLIPNKGDMFVADVGNGKAGVFAVTETERLTYTKEACYTIRYKMTDYLTPDIETQLEAKVIRTYYFELALAELLERPFLTEEDYNTYLDLNEQSVFLTRYFERAFWSRIAGNVALPEQTSLTHDTFHASFCINAGLGSIQNPIISYTNGYMSITEVYSIWDVIRDMDINQLGYCQPTFGIADASVFMEATVARGIAWSQYTYTVYPTRDFFSPNDTESVRTSVGMIKPNGGPGAGVDKYNNGVCMVDQSVIDDNRLQLPFEDLDGDHTIAEGNDAGIDVDTDDSIWNPEPTWEITPTAPKLFPEIGDSHYYVLTEHFYKLDLVNLSVFEKLIVEMLKGRPVKSKDIALCCKKIKDCSLLQQFYFIPIILILIKYAKRGSM